MVSEDIEMLVTKIQCIDDRGTIAVYGSRKGRVNSTVVFIKKTRNTNIPYCYYKINPKYYKTPKELENITHIIKAQVNDFKIFPKEIEMEYNRPTIGYEEQSPFLKITLDNEKDRENLASLIHTRGLLNYYEVDVTYLERAMVELNLNYFGWLWIPGRICARDEQIESLLNSSQAAEYIDDHNDCDLYCCDYPDFRAHARNAFIHGLKMRIGSFRVYAKGSKTEEVYPVAKITKGYKKERHSISRKGNVFPGGHPIGAVSITIEEYQLNKSKPKQVTYFITERRNGGYYKIHGMKYVEISGATLQQIERGIIEKTLALIQTMDICFPYRGTDRFSVNSIQYLLKRYLKYEEEYSFGTKMATRIADLLRLDRDTIFERCRNPFLFTSIVDVFDYINQDAETSKRKIVNDDFRHVFHQIWDKTLSEFEVAKKKKSRRILTQMEISRGFEPYITEEEEKQGMKLKMKMHKLGCALTSDSRLMLSLVRREELLEKTIEYSRESGIDPDIVWTCGKNKQIRIRMLRVLDRMRRDAKQQNFVICESWDMQKKSKIELLDEQEVDTETTSKGGRILDHKTVINDVSMGIIDWSQFYPTILLKYHLDPANLVIFNSKGDEMVDEEDDQRKPKFLKWRSKCANIDLGSAYLKEESMYMNQPNLRFLLDLRLSRKATERDLKNAPESDIPRLRAKIKATKFLMNAFTGILRAKFKCSFSCPILGQVMCWLGRRIFDTACYMVEHMCYAYQRQQVVLRTELEEDEPFWTFEVIGGHTDGFDVRLVSGEHVVDVELNTMRAILMQLTSRINEELPKSLRWLGEMETLNQSIIQLRMNVEMISRKVFYFDKTLKFWVDEKDESIQGKNGAFSKLISNAPIQRQYYEEALEHVFLHGSLSDEKKQELERAMGARLQMMCNNINKFNRVDDFRDFTFYHRLKESANQRKFAPNKDKLQGGNDRLALFLREEQKYPWYPIPILNQHIGHIVVKDLNSGQGEVRKSVLGYLLDRDMYEIDVEYYVEKLSDALNTLQNKLE